MKLADEFMFNLNAMRIAGFVLPGLMVITKLQIFWFVITLLPFTIMDVFNVIDFMTKPRILTEALMDAFVFVNFFSGHFRRFYFIFMKNSILSLIEEWKKPLESGCNEFDANEHEMRQRSTRHIRNFSGLVYLYYVTVAAVFFVLPVMLRIAMTLKDIYDDPSADLGTAKARPLFVKIWWPYNPHQTANYYLLLVWQSLMSLAYAAINTTSDVSVCSLMLAISHRSSLLARTAPVALLPGRRGQLSAYSQAWIKYHQRYLSMLADFSSVFGSFIFMAHYTAVINIVMEMYLAFETEDKVVAAFCVPLLIGLLARIFIYSKCGQQITNKSEQLMASVMGVVEGSRGGQGTGPAHSALQVVRARCCGDPDEVNVLGFFNVSMELFTKVLSAAATYLLVLLHFKKKQTSLE